MTGTRAALAAGTALLGAVATIGAAVPAQAGSAGPSDRTASAARTYHPGWGHTKGRSAVLRRGCHTYHYRYWLTPPTGTWSLEVFIIDPRGKHVAAGAFLGGYDPKAGRGHFDLCRPTSRFGRYRIHAKLSVQNGPDVYKQGWLPPSHFRLHRPH